MRDTGLASSLLRRGLAVAIILMSATTVLAYDFLGNDLGPGTAVTTPDACAALCSGQTNCTAWTFLRAGAQGGRFPTAMCFLKNPAPPAVDVGDNCCLSGTKRSDGWCGESPARTLTGSNVLGQGQVLQCPAGQGCGPRTIRGSTGVCWWFIIPYPCRGPSIQTVDWFCQAL